MGRFTQVTHLDELVGCVRRSDGL